ncbi:(4Fe-4S)-binding protein [Gaetbulibacter aestuarii]|uniref:(4Fe-4S)-binding protein n=1 Tax=Gaetbulibacter aestuarii TaxID=1502358 RepID=A0ABW7MYK6_9FLAO
MANFKNEFSNDELTVSFNPSLCTQCGKCARELSDVFSYNVIPWINLENGDKKAIIKQVKRCPSGALSYRLNIKMKAS